MKANINNNPESSASQERQILDYLMQGNSITPLEALKYFRCFRLGARIADLKAKGHIISSRRVKDVRTGKWFASYTLENGNAQRF